MDIFIFSFWDFLSFSENGGQPGADPNMGGSAGFNSADPNMGGNPNGGSGDDGHLRIKLLQSQSF